MKRLVSNGVLDSPWGLAIASAGFGAFTDDLLVGNFGSDPTAPDVGSINAFDPSNGNLTLNTERPVRSTQAVGRRHPRQRDAV
jgi:hypothetical protein